MLTCKKHGQIFFSSRNFSFQVENCGAKCFNPQGDQITHITQGTHRNFPLDEGPNPKEHSDTRDTVIDGNHGVIEGLSLHGCVSTQVARVKSSAMDAWDACTNQAIISTWSKEKPIPKPLHAYSDVALGRVVTHHCLPTCFAAYHRGCISKDIGTRCTALQNPN